jgi:hypothetical protein
VATILLAFVPTLFLPSKAAKPDEAPPGGESPAPVPAALVD